MSFPNALEHEKKLLSALMLKQGEAVPIVADILSADDFYRAEHQIIFNAILNVFNRGKPFNQLLVLDELNRMGTGSANLRKYFLSLGALEFTTAYVKSYAEEIKEASTKRQVLALTDALRQKAQNPAVTVAELMNDVEAFLAVSSENEQSSFESACAITTSVYQRANELSKSNSLTGVPNGFIDVDKVTNGLQRGELILLAARPAMGKTALALNIARNAARAKRTVALFSLEMSKLQLGIRLLSAASGVEAQKIATGQNLTKREHDSLLEAIEEFEHSPLYIEDTGGLTVSATRTKLRRLKKEYGLDLVVIDYLQLMHGHGENRVQEISEVSRGLKVLAKEFNVPVLALSQLSRNVEMRAVKKPQLSDLRDSGSLEQDADMVWFLYRDEYYNRDESENNNVAELIIAKNRNGSTATIPLTFRKEFTRFDNFAHERSE